MHFFLDYKADLAMLIARFVLGVLFFMQGYDKVFGLGLKNTEAGIVEAMQRTRLPRPLIKATAAVSSIIELLGGLLLASGLFIYPALTVLGIDLLLVVFGMSLREPLWDMRFVWPRLVLLLLLLLLPAAWDRISFDYFLKMYGNSGVIAG